MDAQVSEDTDFIARIRALAPEIAGASDDIEHRRELPPWLLDKLRGGRFFRMLQPRSIGGAELRPVSFAMVTEAIAAADASTGWVVCQNNGCSMSAAYLSPEVAREIFGPPTGILAWGRRAHRSRRSRSMAAIASAASGVSPAAAIMRPGWARICGSPAPAARSAPCCSRNPA